YAIHQPLKLYAGGLGFLAGSLMRSAFTLRQNMIGIGILWKYGYYDQSRKSDQAMDVQYREKLYGFLVKTDIRFTIRVSKHDVWVAVWYLPPDVFKTAPVFFLSTDVEDNDYLAKTISHKLYDSNPETRIAAAILLGVGGAKLLEILQWTPEIYHLNESHALPLAFYLYQRYKSVEEVRKRLIFTNHTPEPSGNQQTNIYLLDKMDFFSGLSPDEVKKSVGVDADQLDHTLTALRLAGIANGVSKLHYKTLLGMWGSAKNICNIIPVTNGQDFNYWADDKMYKALRDNDDEALLARKHWCKHKLFEEVADQNGELYDPHVLTIVFARRFAGYKRADILLSDMDRFHQLVSGKKRPVQIIWAGKPHPMDYNGIAVFDKIVNVCKAYNNCSILTGYELKLSRLLKQGADVWLNMPRITHEASGTSGMSAAMNGAVNVSIPDGWFPEFARDKVNCFVIPPSNSALPEHQQDEADARAMYEVLENTVIPLYYDNPGEWTSVIKHSMQDILPCFDSGRMATEYYEKLYNVVPAKRAT
ncbi:MAG TPA: alpha-glucan family phosphorylase, partial [Chitinophagaceae bacterium]|nr:alpha-glucan family phosphorylase [Chitinophagaceae bacterium]